ncbi:MAG: tRNA (N(6)-L-threonylcarbamoyladenosine(37)-C(2))-methylthiotransferase MtaB, partial [Spirochaetales bacterium]
MAQNIRTGSYTICIETLGCKVNQIESESLARAFVDCGFSCIMGDLSSSTPIDNSLILCILNTCTVTAKSEQKARRLIRLMLNTYPNAIIIVTGCYAEMDNAEIASIDNRLVLVGGKKKHILLKFPHYVQNILNTHIPHEKKSCADFVPLDFAKTYLQCTKDYFSKEISTYTPINTAGLFKLSTDTFLQHSRPSVKIQDGCNYRCSYCRICLARGESISLEPEKILQRVMQLEKAGHSEVVLTGINVSQYKSDNSDLTELLRFLLEHTSTIAFRLASLHPQIITEKLCDVLKHKRIQPHFHLSVQSGSDTILSAMARPYKSIQVKKAITLLRAVKENPFFGCDIIVGFPGESDEDFNETFRLCKESKFAWIHVFPFSPRKDTPAFYAEPKISRNIVT